MYTCVTNKYEKINISNLIIDERVADFFDEDKYIVFPSKYENNLQDFGTYPLDKKRFLSILAGVYTGLPAINVKKVYTNKYMVMNGRHRVAVSIFKGYDYIPVVISTE